MQKTNGQEITKITDTKFTSIWHGVGGSDLVLSFEPIIKQYSLKGTYILLHWQAKPKGLRTWGIYDSLTKMYYSVGSDELIFPACTPRILDVDEKIIKTVPTAVIHFQGLRWLDGKIT